MCGLACAPRRKATAGCDFGSSEGLFTIPNIYLLYTLSFYPLQHMRELEIIIPYILILKLLRLEVLENGCINALHHPATASEYGNLCQGLLTSTLAVLWTAYNFCDIQIFCFKDNLSKI